MDINQAKAPLERAKLVADTDKARGDARDQIGKLAGDLRKERSGLPTTKATQEISAAYNKIQNAAKNPSAAGDLSLVFGYMKILDPGSTVREGEFANAQNAAGVPDRIINIYERVRSGKGLTPEQRADFIGQAHQLYNAQISQQGKIDKDYERLAVKQGINPDDVLLNFGADVPQVERQQLASDGFIPSANAAGVAPSPAKTNKPAQREQVQYRPPGAKVSVKEIEEYALKHKIKASAAKTYLGGLGYAVD
jgi:uncharacterized protein YjbJ (UPF0337 family)